MKWSETQRAPRSPRRISCTPAGSSYGCTAIHTAASMWRGVMWISSDALARSAINSSRSGMIAWPMASATLRAVWEGLISRGHRGQAAKPVRIPNLAYPSPISNSMPGAFRLTCCMNWTNPPGYRMTQVNSCGERRQSERGSGPARPGQGQQPLNRKWRNSWASARRSAGTERVAQRRLGGGRGPVVKPSLSYISMSYSNTPSDEFVENADSPRCREDGGAVRGLQSGLRSGPRAGPQHQRRSAPGPHRRRPLCRSHINVADFTLPATRTGRSGTFYRV